MRKILISAFMVVSLSIAVQAQRQFIKIENVLPEYKRLMDVKPVLMNNGKQSIYLWPQQCGKALVSWMVNEYWWDSDARSCPQILNSIEVKPGHQYEIPGLVARMDLGEGRLNENRTGWPGKFRLSISYSFKPLTRKGPPVLKEHIETVFTIGP